MIRDEERLIEALRDTRCRITGPRRAIIRTILELGGSASPSQVHARARLHCPTLGLVTVYRTLDLLAGMGLVRRIHSENGCRGYAIARRGHHHHLVCRRCGSVVEFEGCDLGSYLGWLSQETGYAIEDHLLELVGLCSDCQRVRSTSVSRIR